MRDRTYRKGVAARAALHARYAGLQGPTAVQKDRKASQATEPRPGAQRRPCGPPGLDDAVEVVETGRLTVEAVARAFGIDAEDLRRFHAETHGEKSPWTP